MSASDHDTLRELTGLHVLGALTGEEREAFAAHLTTCAECREEVHVFQPIVDGLAIAVPFREPPARLKERIMARVGAPSSTAPSASREIRTSGMHPAWLAAAATSVCAAILGYTTFDRQRRIAGLETRLAEVTARANASQALIANVQQTAAAAQSSLAILMAPDVARVDLAGQRAAPQASGRVYWSRSRGLVFTASNLPPLPAGKVYQLWVVTPEAPVSAGLLRPDDTGSVTTTIRTPSTLATPVAMAVTIEPDGGVPAPTGEKYLVGTPTAAL